MKTEETSKPSREGTPNPDLTIHDLETIGMEANKMAFAVNDLLEFLRFDYKGLVAAYEKFQNDAAFFEQNAMTVNDVGMNFIDLKGNLEEIQKFDLD